MKEFNFEAAKAGKPVCTRDGRSVRILCFDRKGYEDMPIMGLIDNGDRETSASWRPDGSITFCIGDSFKDGDLMMATEKREGWVNVYSFDGKRLADIIYKTKEDAIKNALPSVELIDTIKIEWEE